MYTYVYVGHTMAVLSGVLLQGGVHATGGEDMTVRLWRTGKRKFWLRFGKGGSHFTFA